jgi:hypothetical protein
LVGGVCALVFMINRSLARFVGYDADSVTTAPGPRAPSCPATVETVVRYDIVARLPVVKYPTSLNVILLLLIRGGRRAAALRRAPWPTATAFNGAILLAFLFLFDQAIT